MRVAFRTDPPCSSPPVGRFGPALVFFAIVPLLIGLLLGATRAGLAFYFPWAIGILFWAICSVGTWTCMYAGTALAGLVLRPWQPSLWLLLIVGAVLGSLPARYVIYATAEALQGQMLNGREPRPMPPLEASPEFIVHYLQGWAGAYALWLVLGLAFDRLYGLPRYSRPTEESQAAATPPAEQAARGAGTTADAGSTASTAESGRTGPDASPPSRPTLLTRLPEKLGHNVLALEAEDHYVRVHTDRGSTLVLARLSDAIADLGCADGVRVHRSWWVRRDAVRKVSANGKGLLLRLSTGLDVPVSQAYKELARQAGLQPRD